MTMYFIRVMSGIYNTVPFTTPSFRHFESIQGEFYNNLNNYRVLSTNGFAVDPDKFPDGEDYRITRFVRDPRDLIISGYFYHLRGAEPWFRFKHVDPKYWEPINGNVPDKMPPDISFAEYLQSISKEEGLIAEIEFRKFHFQSIREWKIDDRIRLFRYEDILGNEEQKFDELLRFYEVSPIERKLGVWLARRQKYVNGQKRKHIRKPEPGQWQEHFTPRVLKYFNKHYEDVLKILNY